MPKQRDELLQFINVQRDYYQNIKFKSKQTTAVTGHEQ